MFLFSMSESEAAMAKPPVHEIRMGTIKACIWGNETQNGTRHNVTLSRLYKDGDDWKESSSFGRDDLPLAQVVLGRAYEWIFDSRNGEALKPAEEAA
jgi:hypothetical protein